jgi:poly-gamma-glutamate capsule biosynthesis protein CapA/YwtB (metallophosphatase superfamily)
MKVALAGDTMLGRNVGRTLSTGRSPKDLFAQELVHIIHDADLFVVNLECAVSERGQRWSNPSKMFWFRAPPAAVDVLQQLGVDCVTLANNHAMDYGPQALLDTIDLLNRAGIVCVGAGRNEAEARTAAVINRAGVRVAVVAIADHPADFAASPTEPGIAYADLRHGVPDWVTRTINDVDADIVVVTPHWGPNMVTEPLAHVRRAATAFRDAGASLVAGHSAHVFHGVAGNVLYDLGDFIDDYAVDRQLRNDLTLLFLVTFEGDRPTSLEAVPLAIENCHTRLADADESAWIGRRFRGACQALGTTVSERAGRLLIEWEAVAE